MSLTHRVLYAGAAAGFAAAAALAIGAGAPWGLVVAAALAPDLALLAGAGPGLAHGQLHPRAVPAYNALHHVAGPAVLLVFGLVSTAALGAGLAWAFHVTIDRACGYGLRTRDGFQRG
jgi:hypothetical protein